MELVQSYLKDLNELAVITNFLAFFCFYSNILPFWIRIRIVNTDP